MLPSLLSGRDSRDYYGASAPLSLVHLKRSQPSQLGVAEIEWFPRSRIVPRADGGRLLSNPFDAAASSNPVFAPLAVGFEHCRHVAFSLAISFPDTGF